MFRWRIQRSVLCSSLGVMCCLGFWLSGSSVAQTNTPAVSGSETVHIEVSLEGNSANTIPHLSAKNFMVQQGTKSFPIQVTRPSDSKSAAQVGTHVLMLTPPATLLKSTDTRQLREMMARGWQLGVLQADGKTVYSNDTASFAQAVQTAASQSKEQMAAIQELASLPGRRVLIAEEPYVTSQLISKAHRLIPEIYRVRPHDCLCNDLQPPVLVVPENEGAVGPTSNDLVPAFGSLIDNEEANASALSPQSRNGIWRTDNVADAMKVSLENASRYYDVSFSAAGQDMETPVQLIMKRMGGVPSINVSIYALPANAGGTVSRLQVPHSPILVQK